MRSLVPRSRVEPEARAFADPVRSLQGPLDELMAVAELLERQPLSPDAQAQCRALLAAARTLQTVVAALAWDFSAPLPLETACLPELFDGIYDGWQARAAYPDHRLMLSRHCKADDLVYIDAAGFRGALDALVDAALEASDEGVVEVTFKAEALDEGVRIEAAVNHTGRSLAKAFHDTPALDAARRWVAAAGGDIAVAMLEGAGRRVELTFDVALAVVEAEPAPADGAGGPRVLIVDDNATNRMVAEALCALFGFVSEAACDGQEALDAVRQRDFDLILMDIRMPRLDGVAATLAIRALPGAAGRTPIVALTANADSSDVEGYLAAGMCAVVEKPIKPDRLLQAVGQALAGTDRSAADVCMGLRSAA